MTLSDYFATLTIEYDEGISSYSRVMIINKGNVEYYANFFGADITGFPLNNKYSYLKIPFFIKVPTPNYQVFYKNVSIWSKLKTKIQKVFKWN